MKHTRHTSNVVLMPSEKIKTNKLDWWNMISVYMTYIHYQDMRADPSGLRHPAYSISDWKIIHLWILKPTEIDHNKYKARTLESQHMMRAPHYLYGQTCASLAIAMGWSMECVCALLTAWAVEAPEWCCPIIQIDIKIVGLPFSIFSPKGGVPHIRSQFRVSIFNSLQIVLLILLKNP